MLKLFKYSFKTTNDCIILATPLIIFLSILGWYFEYAISSVDTIPKGILALITLFIMGGGFLSAWLYMVKKTIALSKKVFVFDKDRAKALLSLILALPRGIGRLFLPILGVISIYVCIYCVVIILITLLVTNTFGTISIDIFDLKMMLISSQELIEEITNLSQQDLIIINIWYSLFSITSAFITFLTLLWIPEIVYTQKNPFSSLKNALSKLFKNFKHSIILYIYISLVIVLLSILNTLLMFNPFLYFLVLIFYYYFLIYIIVLLFSYYEQNFIDR